MHFMMQVRSRHLTYKWGYDGAGNSWEVRHAAAGSKHQQLVGGRPRFSHVFCSTAVAALSRLVAAGIMYACTLPNKIQFPYTVS